MVMIENNDDHEPEPWNLILRPPIPQLLICKVSHYGIGSTLAMANRITIAFKDL